MLWGLVQACTTVFLFLAICATTFGQPQLAIGLLLLVVAGTVLGSLVSP
jgi:hypothetical protein